MAALARSIPWRRASHSAQPLSAAHPSPLPSPRLSTLVLDAANLPVLEQPLVPWQHAFVLFCRGAEVLSHHQNFIIRSGRGNEYEVPAVLRWPTLYNQANRNVAPNLDNLMLRDMGICAYTGRRLYRGAADPNLRASVDHVVPLSRGGSNTWSNVVLAASAVNNFKNDRLPDEAGLPLLFNPWTPSLADLTYLALSLEAVNYTQFGEHFKLPHAPHARRAYLNIMRAIARLE